MSSWARVGVKCVCVDAVWERCDGVYSVTPNPIVGKIYLVEEVVDGGAFIGIVELQDDYFETCGFRPLISQADDIAMFQKLVDTMKPTERLDRLMEMMDDA